MTVEREGHSLNAGYDWHGAKYPVQEGARTAISQISPIQGKKKNPVTVLLVFIGTFFDSM